MSKVDYSKFDNIVDSDEDDNLNKPDPIQGLVQIPSVTAATSDVPLVYAPRKEVASQLTPVEAGMTHVDPSQVDPSTAAQLGLRNVGTMDEMKQMRKQYKHNGQVSLILIANIFGVG